MNYTAIPAENLDVVVARLSEIPWCAKLLSTPDQVVDIYPSRISRDGSTDTYFASALKTEETISNFVLLYKNGATPNALVEEAKAIFTIGGGLNGFPDIVHGGMVASLMDEVMGFLSVHNRMIGATPQGKYMTVYLNTQFKAPVMANSTYLAVARVDKVEGRKMFTSQTIQDGEGNVLATGNALFVNVARPKL